MGVIQAWQAYVSVSCGFLPLGLLASSRRTCWEATVRGRSSVCCFRLSCAECRACVRTSPSASVYLTSPRFELIVDTLLSYEFSFSNRLCACFGNCRKFLFLFFFLLLPGFAVLLVLWIVQAPSVTVHQYLPTFNTEIHCLSSLILNRVWSFVSHENAKFPF